MHRKTRPSPQKSTKGILGGLLPSIAEIKAQLEIVVQERIESYRSLPPDSVPPRPTNAFILWRSFIWSLLLLNADADRNNRNLSRTAGDLWKTLPREVVVLFEDGAERIKQAHQAMFPGYTYKPKGSKSKAGKSRMDEVLTKSPKASRQTVAKKASKLQSKKRVVYGLNRQPTPTRGLDLVPQTPAPSPQLSSSSIPTSPSSSRSASPSEPEMDEDDVMDEDSDDSHSEMGSPQSMHEELCESMEDMELSYAPSTAPSMDLTARYPELAYFKPSAFRYIGNAMLTETALSYPSSSFYRNCPSTPISVPALEPSSSSSPSSSSPSSSSPSSSSSSSLSPEPSYDSLLATPESAPLDLDICNFSSGDGIAWDDWLNDDVISRDGQ